MRLFSLLFVSIPILAQPPQRIIFVTSDPVGACNNNQAMQYNPTSGKLSGCSSSTWGVLGSTSGPSGNAGGSLAGTYPNPSIASSVNLPGQPTTGNPSSSTSNTQLATTSFVQGLLASLNQAVSVQAATVTILPGTPTYNNGSSGVGATLTAGTNGALAAIDGYTASVGDRLLINNQVTQNQNGVYTLTTLGNGGAPYVLTRATDFNTVTEINTSGAIPVLNGTVNNNTLWVLNVSITAIGTGAPGAAISYNLGATTPFPVLTITNAGSTGTTLNKLVKLTGAPSTAIITATTDTSGAIGICSLNCGTSGVATITQSLIQSCIFDGATTAGDYVQISSSTAGDCHDFGSSFPSSGQVIGRVMTTNSGGGTFSVILFSPDIVVQAAKQLHSITYSINGSGSVLTTGDAKVYQSVDFACTINRADIVGSPSGSVSIDIWKVNAGIPVAANKISASAPIALSSAQLAQNVSLSGWTTSVVVGDVFDINISSATTITQANLTIWCQ